MINYTRTTTLLAFSCLLSFASIYSGEIELRLYTKIHTIEGKEIAVDKTDIVLGGDDSSVKFLSYTLDTLKQLKNQQCKPLSLAIKSPLISNPLTADVEELTKKHEFNTPEFIDSFKSIMAYWHDSLLGIAMQKSAAIPEKTKRRQERYADRLEELVNFLEEEKGQVKKFSFTLTFEVEDQKNQN